MTSPALGSQAPGFTLLNTEKKEFSLSHLEGKKAVILFFPFAFTGVCTDELCAMRDQLAEYNDLGAEVVAISVDSPFTLEKFKAENNLNFEVLSDFNKVVAPQYGAFYEEFVMGLKGVAKRAVFVLDENHKIIHSEVLEDASQMPNFQNVKEALSQ